MTMPVVDLSSKLAIITGANSGIGFEAARALAELGAYVILACRNKSRAEEAKKLIIESTGNFRVEVEVLDCASFASVRAFLSRWQKKEPKQVDILINNAGGFNNTISFTDDGYEQTYQSNHLSHVLLTHGLLNSGCIASNGRIVSVSSLAYYNSDPLNNNNVGNSDILASFDNQVGARLSLGEMIQTYSRSKAAQVVWSMALQRRLSSIEGWKGITVHSCNPGFVKTDIWTQPSGFASLTDMASNLFKSAVQMTAISTAQGAVTPIWLATAAQPISPGMEGRFWDRMQWKWPTPWSLDVGLQDELWDLWCGETDAPLR
ncbi:unnamed protein product [Rhizoctonia solani]|uniref:Uncharacterized protein n=1 Tax=Rhizoctonia solani TaxID=456999 RepID=A0A8H2WLC3_9AGAM|nr:unnamed protein product [Rhizoctonia solani]